MQALAYLTAMGALTVKALGHGDGAVHQFLGSKHGVDQAHLFGLVSLDHLAGENQLLGLGDTHTAGQTLGAGEAGVMPRPTSGWPNLAFSLARMMSQDMAISQPPPRAKPFTAAMVGISSFSMRRKMALPR